MFDSARWIRADRVLFERSGALRPSPADPALRILSRLADHSVLWMGCAAVGTAVGGTPRRAVVRGLLSVAGASALANGVLKPLLPRRRPPARVEPQFRRRTVPMPTSSSFPSGHAASAAAFATGVALESPATAAVVAPLAAAVAYSRVHTGVHWPSDVLVGAAVGTAIALGTRRWWAVRDDEPAVAGPAAAAPAAPTGRGLLVVVNPGSGNGDSDHGELRAALPDARIVTLPEGGDLAAELDRLLTEHAPVALGVDGGDGTVVAVAGAAVAADLPLAVFPGGTLNHFARDAGAAEPGDTIRAVAGGHAVRIDLGRVTVAGGVGSGGAEHTFVNTASLGGYPDSVRLRERWEPRIGKWPAAAAAMARVLATASPLTVRLDGTPRAVWLLFVGNGRYTPTDRIPMSRPALTGGTLDVRYLRADRRWSRLRLLTAVATGSLDRSPTYVQQNVAALAVRIDGPPVALATDGEVVADGTAFDFRSAPAALTLYRLPDQES
ncbi:bifunctional phosphatase PAP2/diacylglycerol kinase family protein [Rhodococcus zopfii]|uniref:bifunctional phosphatase PAP2/diacylglycerol kinase family protein n=1 Tax=Rhodococcus zopfii TaxID=43772 RepID=UPI0011113623|nr:bifunctional phosphatase PAP2/diacylglycerol kinase family protein [Rhodococcus zopfii]